MASASNMYLLNGVDMYDTYGWVTASGSDDFLRPPTMDEPFSHKFRDQNGFQWDLTTPTFTPEPAILRGNIFATSASDWWSKYNALFGITGVLRTPGTKQLTIVQFDRVFEVFYRAVPTIARHTRLKDNPSNKIIVGLEIKFEVVNSYSITGVQNFYGGGVASMPGTWAAVAAMPGQPDYLGNIFEVNTGTTHTTFAISIPNDRTLYRVRDLSASNANLTPIFALQGSVVSPGGKTYNIYGFSQSIPYSINHVYQVEVI